MKRVLLILTLCFPLIAAGYHNDDHGSVPVSPSGYIDITVESNVNSLSFKHDLTGMYLTLSNRVNTAFVHGTSLSVVRVPVKEFRSTNQIAYRDFLELIKAEEYPHFEIAIPNERASLFQTGSAMILEGVTVTVAGVTRNYNISCKIEASGTDQNNKLLTGIIRVKLTDLKIEPPVKWAGLVKVKNEIIVKFGLCIKNLPESPVNT